MVFSLYGSEFTLTPNLVSVGPLQIVLVPKKIVDLQNSNIIGADLLLDPPSGPMKPALSVSQSVCQFVSDESSHTSCHQFSQIFCIKLLSNECTKVTKPDFQKKMCLQVISLFVFKIEVFRHFLEIATSYFAKNFRIYSN